MYICFFFFFSPYNKGFFFLVEIFLIFMWCVVFRREGIRLCGVFLSKVLCKASNVYRSKKMHRFPYRYIYVREKRIRKQGNEYRCCGIEMEKDQTKDPF